MAVDLPGWGESPAGRRHPHSAESYADALHPLLERLGPVSVVAHSMGVQVALLAARARPEPRRLVLLAPPVLPVAGVTVPPRTLVDLVTLPGLGLPAARLVMEIMKRRPPAPEARQNFPANNRVFLAWAKLRMRPWYKDLDQANALVEQALRIDPTDAMALHALMQLELERRGPRATYATLRARFLPWGYYCATTRPFVAEPMLVQMRKWAIEYRDPASLPQIDSSLARAGRVIEAVRTEQALGWRE